MNGKNAINATLTHSRVAIEQPAPVKGNQRDDIVLDCKVKEIHYGDFLAVRDSHVPIDRKQIAGFIGPSGCGKSTVLRSLNRMNDFSATEPEVLLMDEPCSALDPIATRQVEELMLELKENHSVALVTHNMQQATRVVDKTAFFGVDMSAGGRTGYLVEMGETSQIFNHPREQVTQQAAIGTRRPAWCKLADFIKYHANERYLHSSSKTGY